MTREIKFRIPMFTDKGSFTGFQYLNLGDEIIGTLCGYNGETQQYTGLKDKNGKEIYEGDILNFEGVRNYEVKFIRAGFAVDFEDGHRYLGQFANCKIIGNIYENPELIKK